MTLYLKITQHKGLRCHEQKGSREAQTAVNRFQHRLFPTHMCSENKKKRCKKKSVPCIGKKLKSRVEHTFKPWNIRN